jgi:nitric oxide reductase subunit C
MLSKSAAKAFFLSGTVVCAGAFILLTIDTIQRVPAQTHQENITEAVIRGKDHWDTNNCAGCHTLLGEGGYYAPELTQVYTRRGETFIAALLKDPEAMYPGQRRMVKYNFSDEQISDIIAFLKWISEMDLNGFPPKPDLLATAVVPGAPGEPSHGAVAERMNRPMIFNQMCIACHSLDGQGGKVGPALDDVGDRRDRANIAQWLTDPQSMKPGALMPKLPLSKEDIAELAAFLSELKTSGVKK